MSVLINCDFTNTYMSNGVGRYTGGIVAFMVDGIIENCEVNGKIEGGSSEAVGGIAVM